jgi:outer membrane protein
MRIRIEAMWDRLAAGGGLAMRLAPVAALAASLHAQQTMHLTLAEAQRLAIQNNPTFSAARYTAAAAHQVPAQYESAMQPSVSGLFSSVGADNGTRLAAGGLNNPVVYDRVGSGIAVSQLVTDFGRTKNLVGMAKLQAQAQDQSTETTRAQILLGTSQAYFGVLRAQALLEVAQQTVSARELVSRQVTTLADAKLKSTLDVSFANVNLADAKLQLAQAQNDLQSAQTQLATVMGLPNETAFGLSEEAMPAQLPDRVSDLIREAIQNRPELAQLRFEQGAAERLAAAEHDLYYPSVGIIGTMGVAPFAESSVSSRYGAIGLNVTIPIFNGGLFKARTEEARLKAQAAAQNLTSEQNLVIRDVRVAWLNATTAYDKLALTRQLLDQAQQALRLARMRYDSGLGSIVELSQAQLNLTSAQIANTSAIFDYQARRVNVDYQTGVLR